MKLKINIALLVACSAMLVLSCNKPATQNNTSLPSLSSMSSSTTPIADFFQILSQPVDGDMSLVSVTSLAVQNEPCDPAIFAGGYDDNGNRKCFGPVEVTKLGRKFIVYRETPCPSCYQTNHTLSSSFGQVIGLEADLATSGSSFVHDMYAPTKVLISSPTFVEEQAVWPGEVFNWNPDPSNPYDDVIYITYDPTSYENAGVSGGATDPKAIGIEAGNMGTYTITAADLANFPTGAYLYISVNRYNFETFNNPDLNKEYLAVLGSTVKGLFINGGGTPPGGGGAAGGGGEE